MYFICVYLEIKKASRISKKFRLLHIVGPNTFVPIMLCARDFYVTRGFKKSRVTYVKNCPVELTCLTIFSLVWPEAGLGRQFEYPTLLLL
jgi:hypothetical protein